MMEYAPDDCYVYVEAFLTDESRVSGYVCDFDGRLDSGENRDIVLSWPVTYLEPGGTKLSSEADYVALLAPQVKFLAVHHGVPHPNDPDCSE